jgi:hypothetical protein
VVSIDPVIQRKLDGLALLESQFYEGGALGSADLVPKDPAKQLERRQQVRANHAKRFQGLAGRFRSQLETWYGKERAAKIEHAEAFELCEYGRQPTADELRKLFPFFPGQ